MFDLILEYRDEVQRVLGFVICLCALRWGGAPERWTALVLLLVFQVGDAIYHLIFGAGFELSDVDVGHAVLDVTASVLLVGIALQANRLYPLWIAAFQLVATTAHVAREIAVMMKPIAYAILAISPSYFQLLILLGGLAYHVKRKKIWGDYRDWRIKVST
ncbi:hypothetical protein [Altererythrobacter lutimaris]|uniref:Uncharacterized protein n=1 Tax=Altererythrobacter lutimaris TaxID=2743979 RepID=A0A850H974_9SPHN|nr:hypothetical protein [Altererythrobacter lutimaris]NVE95864.1 hypothetical protein [Altererythrobacter lutimaris]